MPFKVANAPCSWGVIENIAGQRTSYQQVIDEIRETGYIGTELGDWGFMPTTADALAAELAQRELALVGSWVSVMLHDASKHAESEANAVRTARLLAEVGEDGAVIVLGNDPYGDPHRTAISGRVRANDAMPDAQWQVFADGAMRVAAGVRAATGLRTVYHPHVGTWVETPAETEKLLAMTDPQLLGMCFDTGHWRFGGGDPVAAIAQFGERIWHVHFKDHDPRVAALSREQAWDGPTSVRHGVFCELGRGDVNFPAVVTALGNIGYGGWIVVEQDVLPGMGTPRTSAARNRDYLRGIGL